MTYQLIHVCRTGSLLKLYYLDELQKQEVSTNSTGKDANENLKNSVLSLEKGSKNYFIIKIYL